MASPFCFNFRLHIEWLVSLLSADDTRVGGSRCKLQGSGGSEGGPEPVYVAYIFFVFLFSIIICKLHKLTL